MNKKLVDYYSPVSSKSKRIRSRSSPELNHNSPRRKKISLSNMGDENTDFQISSMTRSEFESFFASILEKKLENINNKLEHVVRKADLAEICKSQNDDLKDENQRLKQEIMNLKENNQYIHNQLEGLIQEKKRNNLIFHGLNYAPGEDYINLIKTFCSNTLGLRENCIISKEYPLGQRSKLNLPIVASFLMESDVNFILKNANQLKGTQFVISQDLTEVERWKRSKLLAIRKRIRNIDRNIAVHVSRQFIFIQGFKFPWKEDGLFFKKDQDAITKLNQIVNHDMSGFINELLMENFTDWKRKREPLRLEH